MLLSNIKNIIFDLGVVIVDVNPLLTIDKFKEFGIKDIDHLLDHHTDREAAKILNEKGYRSSVGKLPFTAYMIARLRHSHHIKSHCERLRERGMLTAPEMAKKLNISTCTLETWCKKGLLKRYPCNRSKYFLYGRH